MTKQLMFSNPAGALFWSRTIRDILRPCRGHWDVVDQVRRVQRLGIAGDVAFGGLVGTDEQRGEQR